MPNDPPLTLPAAMRRRGFLLTAWPWRVSGYLLSTPPVALVAALPLALLGLPLLLAVFSDVSLGARAVLAAVGVLLIAGLGPPAAIPLAALERRRLRLVDPRPTRSGHRRPPEDGIISWLRTRYSEPVTCRELGYFLLLVTAVPVLYGALATALLLQFAALAAPLMLRKDDVPVVLGPATLDSPAAALPYVIVALALLPAVPYLLALTAAGQAALARTLLQRGPGERFQAELVEVAHSRARLVGAFDAERRRIERDLHDGAQQRLLSLTMKLGLARMDLPPGPAADSVADAHQEAKQLMTELRELVHGIHPRVLTDRGLAAALGELADRSPLAVTVQADIPGRQPRHVESTAYFVAAEALTNAAKHSGADKAGMTARWDGGVLTLEITDNGVGGADPDRGTGLTGLADRVAVIDGRLLVSSPIGGPTTIRVELPCSLNEPA
ncbi:signal transduction histidine kinase [Actinomadura pelletieri DSM 43383]|uniref:histidine kinase n=1 Tax=Actinomadura pelletieri DSM 43383 TaxID=1120940 RepID=A0A495QXR2_9ACTN|nr:sensor histidine kinase [Actinomadura pelletieri]RKS78814.1 signal transduction histidine kinase [Actinomadura pelletieri DSM 43383]